MPFVPPAPIESIPSSDRRKLVPLLQERTVMQYAFSLKTLTAQFVKLGLTPEKALETVRKSIVATDETEAKNLRHMLNEEISTIMLSNNITSLAGADPFGEPRQYIYMESKSAGRIAKDRLQTSMLNHRINPKVAAAILEESWVEGTPYTTLQIRKPKAGKEENGGE